MNKKLLLLTLLFMLFSVSFVSAQRICKSDDVLDVLRKALYIYYTDPEGSSFTPAELKDLLGFYVGIQTGQVTIDCTEQESNIDRANALQDQIPSCSDGTKYGKCSNTKPIYCYAGRLVPRCRLCGCPTGQWCDITYVYTEKGNKGQWGKCYPGTNITCAVDSDCGISSYIGDYYCNKDKDVYRNYTQYTCFNPGGINSNCTRSDRVILIDDCNATEQCVEGQAECQTTGNKSCNQDSDCGIPSYTDYCKNNDVYRDYMTYPCLGPGTSNSSCSKVITNILQDDCNITEYCQEGVASCQVNFTVCEDGTNFNSCSTTKPKYCQNGTLIDNCYACGSCQVSENPYTTVWNQSYSGNYSNNGLVDLVVGNEGNLYPLCVVQHPTAGGSMDNNWKLLKIDSASGNELYSFEKGWGGQFGLVDDTPTDALIASDGSIIAVGRIALGGDSAGMMKFDYSLNPLWSYEQKYAQFSSVTDIGNGILIACGSHSCYPTCYSTPISILYALNLNDGRKIWSREDHNSRGFHSITKVGNYLYVLNNVHTFTFETGHTTDVNILKLDLNGNYITNWTFGDVSDNKTNHGRDIISTSDGGFIMIGRTNSYGAGSYDIWVMKYDSSDNLKWIKTLGYVNYDSASRIVEIKNNPNLKGFAIAGTANDKDGWLMIIDQNGNKVWEKIFDLGGTESGSGVAEDSSGNLYFGITDNTNTKIVLYKLSPQ